MHRQVRRIEKSYNKDRRRRRKSTEKRFYGTCGHQNVILSWTLSPFW